MSTALTAPATHSQPSRKGKRAWRKNVDIEPVTAGLDSAREEYRQTGGQLLNDLRDDQLFQTDTVGNEAVRKRAEKRHGKLKADEIIEARSKIPAVEARKTGSSNITDGVLKRKRDGIPAKERARLWRLANSGGNAASQGVIQASEDASYDPWAEPAERAIDPQQSYLDPPKPRRAPETIREKPIPMTADGKSIPSVPKPHAGRSYNPDIDYWDMLNSREEAKAIEAEKMRVQQEVEEQEKAERIAIAAAEAEREEQDRTVMSEHESEWEGFQSEPDESMLKAKRPGRKTPQERNKTNRRKAAEALERHNEKMRLREKQERQLQDIVQSTDRHHRQKLYSQTFDGFSSDEDTDGVEGQENYEPAKRPKLGKKWKAPEQDLELVLGDELEESLRRLKPEGNLLKDRYRTMILQGKTEGRTPIPMQKKPRRKATEKWSYKDWTLDNA